MPKIKKIRYGIYEGLLLAVVTSILNPLLGYHDLNIMFIIAIFTIYPLLTGIGGFLGKMTDENSRQTFKTKLRNRNFHPIITIIAGIFVTFVIGILLALISYLISSTSLNSFNSLLIDTITFVGASLIGGFIATYFAKEKKIQYGIYVGISIAIIIELVNLYKINTGYHTPYIFNPYIVIGASAGYLLAATIGDYIGIMADKRLKQTTTKTGGLNNKNNY